MNLVGKIFTVIIFLLCIMFTSMATMVFSTHQNWLLKGLDKDKLLAEATKKYNDLMSEKTALVEDKKREHDTAEERLAKLQSALDQLTPKLAAAEKLMLEKDDQIRGLAAAAKSAHLTLDSLRADAEKLRTDIRDARAERDQRYAALVKATDDLHSAIGERDGLARSNRDLVAQIARDNEYFRWNHVDPNGDYKSKDPPAALEGEVTDARQQNNIEISIGADDGLRPGHKLEVIRTGSPSAYVGRIEVYQLSGNRAVCRPVQNMQKSAIQKGDHVYASLSKFTK